MTFCVCVLLVVDERPTASARSYIAVNIGSSIERYLHRKVKREVQRYIIFGWICLFPLRLLPRRSVAAPKFPYRFLVAIVDTILCLCSRQYNLGERSPYTDDFSANSLPLAAWLLFPLGYVGVHTTDIPNIDIRKNLNRLIAYRQTGLRIRTGIFFFFSK